MKSLFIIVLLLPVFLLGQKINSKNTNTDTQQQMPPTQVVFTNQGTLLFPDGTEQTTAYPGNMRTNGSMPGDFQITSNGGVQFPDGTVQTTAYIPGSNPPQNLSNIVVEFSPNAEITGPAQGLISGVNIVDGLSEISSISDGLQVNVNITGGVPPSASVPSFGDISFTRQTDENSARIRGLLAKGFEINSIKVYKLKPNGQGNYGLLSVAKYETCFLTGYNVSFVDGDVSPIESVSFTFVKACYASYELDQDLNPISILEGCWDRNINNGGAGIDCNCSF